jgi:hypothetical protein
VVAPRLRLGGVRCRGHRAAGAGGARLLRRGVVGRQRVAHRGCADGYGGLDASVQGYQALRPPLAGCCWRCRQRSR